MTNHRNPFHIPARDSVVTGELHISTRALSNNCSHLAEFFSDDGPRRLSSVDVLDLVITELGARFSLPGSKFPWGTRQHAKRITSRMAKILALFPFSYKGKA